MCKYKLLSTLRGVLPAVTDFYVGWGHGPGSRAVYNPRAAGRNLQVAGPRAVIRGSRAADYSPTPHIKLQHIIPAGPAEMIGVSLSTDKQLLNFLFHGVEGMFVCVGRFPNGGDSLSFTEAPGKNYIPPSRELSLKRPDPSQQQKLQTIKIGFGMSWTCRISSTRMPTTKTSRPKTDLKWLPRMKTDHERVVQDGIPGTKSA